MIACVDVDYRAAEAVAACIEIERWTDATPARESVVRTAGAAAAYQPGGFYLRELPCILAVLASVRDVALVVVDGYVWLARERPGLGARLHAALGGRAPVVGVAKTAFRGNDAAAPVLRGRSARPLYVTAIGMDVEVAAAHVASMHGDHRVPTILARVDRLARDA